MGANMAVKKMSISQETQEHMSSSDPACIIHYPLCVNTACGRGTYWQLLDETPHAGQMRTGVVCQYEAKYIEQKCA